MKFLRRDVLKAGAGIAASAFAAPAIAQTPTVKIGVLTDMSSLYTDLSGQGSVLSARMAAEDFGGRALNQPIEVIFADHQNRADVGANLARQWLERDGVSVITCTPNSAVALAVNQIVKDRNRVFVVSGAASSDLTGPACTPNTVHWTYDTWALANGTGRAVVAAGGDTWFFLTADYAFGHALERDTAAVVRASGGRVVGQVRHPLNNQDFSSFLLQAQASRAKVIGMANAGGDTINTIKQAAEFGIVRGGQKLAGLLVFLTDVHALGLPVAQGLQLTEAFYWDTNDNTRAYARRIAAQNRGIHPTMIHAGVYAGMTHYLKAVREVGAIEGARVVEAMKRLPTDDPLFGQGTIRQDGRKIHPMYLFEVKAPNESRGPWDYYKLIRPIPADSAFRPVNEGNCPLVRG
jgi:branched-chain amino acid transport system substrate-binding protein